MADSTIIDMQKTILDIYTNINKIQDTINKLEDYINLVDGGYDFATLQTYEDVNNLPRPGDSNNLYILPDGIYLWDETLQDYKPTSSSGGGSASVYEVSTEDEMLALNAKQGDFVIRTDTNSTYILKQLPADDIDNWIYLPTSAASVESVNGFTGVVHLTTDDIPEGPNNKYHKDSEDENSYTILPFTLDPSYWHGSTEFEGYFWEADIWLGGITENTIADLKFELNSGIKAHEFALFANAKPLTDAIKLYAINHPDVELNGQVVIFRYEGDDTGVITTNISTMTPSDIDTPVIPPEQRERYGVSWDDNESLPALTRINDAVGLNTITLMQKYPFKDATMVEMVSENQTRNMVRIPRFYISKTKTGTTNTISICQTKYDNSYIIHPAFLKGNIQYTGMNPETDYNNYIFVHEIDEPELAGMARGDLRAACLAKGAGYSMMDLVTFDCLIDLYLIFYATRASQNNPTTMLGIKNIVGNNWGIPDGINIDPDGNIYVSTKIDSYAGATSTGYTKVSYKLPVGTGYIKTMGYDQNLPFVSLPIDITATSSTHYCGEYNRTITNDWSYPIFKDNGNNLFATSLVNIPIPTATSRLIFRQYAS